MANIKINKSAVRREKQDQRKKATNHFRRQTMRTYIKRARASKTSDCFLLAQKHIDICLKHHIIHSNTAARLKSRLHKAISA